MSFSLNKASISSNNTFNEQLTKLRQVLREYNNKFLMEYEDMKIFINPKDIVA